MSRQGQDPTGLIARVVLAACVLASGLAEGQSEPTHDQLASGGGLPVFARPPADLAEVAAVIPRGNVNPAPDGGHIRPVKHMYLDYVTPRNGGNHLVDVYAMAAGTIVALFQRQTGGLAAGPVDEYQIWIQHSAEVTIYYDHLHELDARLGLPDWRDNTAGWVDVGGGRFLFLGLNGARSPVRVHPARGWAGRATTPRTGTSESWIRGTSAAS